MKKITFFLFFVLSCCLSQQLTAVEYDIVGSCEYGRIYHLLYDQSVENRVYAVTLANHIVVSEDNGNTWKVFYALPSGGQIKFLRLTANGTALSFASYVVNTSPDNKLHVLDINTRQMIKELSLPNADMGAWIEDYDIHAQDNNVIVVNTSYREDLLTIRGKTFYTTNGGQNWKQIYYTADSNVSINNVAISPDNPQKIFLSRGMGGGSGVDGGILISEDGGDNWTEKLPDVILGPITFHPENPADILIGTGVGFSLHPKNLYRSTDGGNTWEVQDITWNDGILNNVLDIVYNPGNLNHIIVLGESEIVLSRDGGNTWATSIYDPYGSYVYEYYYGISASFNPFNPEEVFIGCDYHPFFSTDGGETLIRVKNPFFVTTGGIVKYVPAAEEGGHLYYGLQYGYIHRNLTNGEENPYHIMDLNMAGLDLGIDFFTDEEIPGRVYILSSGWMGANLSVSDNHGATARATFPVPGYNSRCRSLCVDPNNRDIVWAFFSDNSLRKIDFSQSPPTATAVNLPYEPQDAAEVPAMGIHVYDDNSDHALLTFADELYETTDAGANWTKITAGLESGLGFIYSLTQNPLNKQQFAMTANTGIYTSTDSGHTWTKRYTGLVYKVRHSSEVDGHLIAFIPTSLTTSFEILYSTNSGSTWDKIDNKNLDYILSASADGIFTGGSHVDIYIGTIDIGLIKYTLDMKTGTGLIVNETAADIIVYPNPVTAGRPLNVKLPGGISSTNIRIIDLSGRLIQQSENVSGTLYAPIQPGIYLLQIQLPDGNQSVQKIIVE